METKCEHPTVRVVAREEDAEYMECLECGEVFDSEELRDMTPDIPSDITQEGDLESGAGSRAEP